MRASRPVTRRLVLIAIALAVLAGLARIALHSYEVVADDFDQSPALPLLQHPDQVGIEHLESVTFPGDNATHLAAWYVAAKNRGAVILVHGTNTDRSSMVAEMRILSAAGFGVLAFDWPGHGVSDGSVRWRAPERHALEAAIDWLAARQDVDPQRLGGLGFSMGAYLMAQVAATDRRLRAIMLLAVPSDYTELTHWQHRKWGIFSELPATVALHSYGYPNEDQRPIDVIAQISPRALELVRGTNDQVVPDYMIRALYAAARPPKSLWIIPGANHGGYAEVAPVEYPARLVKFFTEHLLVDPPAQ
jgi:dipeptidyl aminopeptidase/acylaminoacyl peptidase